MGALLGGVARYFLDLRAQQVEFRAALLVMMDDLFRIQMVVRDIDLWFRPSAPALDAMTPRAWLSERHTLARGLGNKHRDAWDALCDVMQRVDRLQWRIRFLIERGDKIEPLFPELKAAAVRARAAQDALAGISTRPRLR